jgi:hypothetical protein
LAAVGSLHPRRVNADIEQTRTTIGALLDEVALTAGYDARAVFELARETLESAGLGTVSALALLETSPEGGSHVSGHGTPGPVVILPDLGATVATSAGCGLQSGSAVVLEEPKDEETMLALVVA